MLGAAARLISPDHPVIINGYALYAPEELEGHSPRVIFVDGHSRRVDPAHTPAGSGLVTPHHPGEGR